MYLSQIAKCICVTFKNVFPKSRRPPTTNKVVARRWVDESRTTRTSDQIWLWRNSESGPRAELWRFRLFGIESRSKPEGKVQISNEPPGVVKNCSHQQWSSGKKIFILEKFFRHSLVEKTNLDFSTMLFESRPLRYNFTPYQAFTIWNVFYHPHLHIYPPTQAAIPHIAPQYLHKIPPNVFIPRTHPTRVEGDKTPHGAVGL